MLSVARIEIDRADPWRVGEYDGESAFRGDIAEFRSKRKRRGSAAPQRLDPRARIAQITTQSQLNLACPRWWRNARPEQVRRSQHSQEVVPLVHQPRYVFFGNFNC
jgi:hypothetical protein